MRSKTVLTVVGCVLAGALSGCGSSGPPSSAARNTGQAGATVQASSQTSTSQTAASFNAAKTWTWDTKNTDSYTGHYELAIEAPVGADSVPVLVGFSQRSDISGACSDFNVQTDALLPIQLTLTNTTGGFSREVAAFFSLAEYTEREIREEVPYGPKDVEVVSGYSQGAECKEIQRHESTNDQSSWAVSCQLQPNASCTTYGYLVLKNYYSPSAPQGNSSALSAVNLDVSTTTSTSEETFTHATGPGVGLPPSDPGLAMEIPLSGSAPVA
jgi:hypothetical protein